MGVFIVFWRLLLGILGDTRAHSYRGGWLGLSKCYELNRKMGRGIVEEAMENSLFFVREEVGFTLTQIYSASAPACGTRTIKDGSLACKFRVIHLDR